MCFSIISSKPFRFIVGPEKREFMLHAAAVARQSKSLDTLVNGEMKEAREACAVWEEMDEDTFIRFGQFAYTGDYDAATPQESVDISPGASEAQADPGETSPFPVARKKKWPEETGKRAQRWTAFKEHRYLEAIPLPQLLRNGEREDYTEVFLSHAKMFIFAEYRGIRSLEMLSLHKLRDILAAFKLHKARISDIVQLIRYTYENTGDESARVLRDLVADYAACNAEEMWQSEDFRNLLEVYGDYAKDIVGRML